MARFLCVVLAIVILAQGNLLAQPPAAEAPTEEFADVYGKWQALDQQIDEVINAYRSAEPAERNALVERYNDLASQSREIMPRLRVAAIRQYKAEPNQNEDVTKTLVGLLANDVRLDKYESAIQLAGLLMEHECPEPVINAFAGIAAYCMDDFATAENHLKKAEESQALISTAQVCLQDLPTAKKEWERERTLREQEAKTDDLPRVKFETSKGPIVIELYENEAPQSVGNFVSLVESGFYNGLTFHRVLPGFMAQGGCPDGTGAGGPGYDIPCECYEDNHRRHFRGTLSMAHAGRDTGGSQFFLTFKRTSHLDGKHTVFGRVIEGLDILAEIQRRDPGQAGELPTPDKIVKAEVVRKRDHEYKPTKVGDTP